MPMNQKPKKVARSASQRKEIASPINFTTFVSAHFDHFLSFMLYLFGLRLSGVSHAFLWPHLLLNTFLSLSLPVWETCLQVPCQVCAGNSESLFP